MNIYDFIDMNELNKNVALSNNKRNGCASILHIEIAINMSKKIIRAFVMMRYYISSNLIEQKYINDLVLEEHNKIKIIEKTFKKLEEKKKENEIYFNGQIYDAYLKILEIFKIAKKELIVIDAYADNAVLVIYSLKFTSCNYLTYML